MLEIQGDGWTPVYVTPTLRWTSSVTECSSASLSLWSWDNINRDEILRNSCGSLHHKHLIQQWKEAQLKHTLQHVWENKPFCCLLIYLYAVTLEVGSPSAPTVSPWYKQDPTSSTLHITTAYWSLVLTSWELATVIFIRPLDSLCHFRWHMVCSLSQLYFHAR